LTGNSKDAAGGKTRKKQSLGQRTTRGFAWLLMQTLGSKGINVLGQIALA
jgi:hypothetical protein